MSVYLISRFKIHDRDAYDRYEAGFGPIFERYDGKMLSVDENPKVLQGDWNYTRSVLIEFPNKASAYAWMTSPEYQEIAKDRLEGSTGESIMVESFEG